MVPDDYLDISIEILTEIDNMSRCSLDGLCPASSQQRHTPPPSFHVHIENSELTVNLYVQSETLWFLPPFDKSLSDPRKAKLPFDLVLASDQTVLPQRRPGRGSGVWSSASYPVLALRAHVLLEAFLRLYARDIGTRVGSFAMAMIGYMEEYVDDDGLLDADRLPQPLRDFYRELKEAKKPVRQWTDELKDALRKDDQARKLTRS